MRDWTYNVPICGQLLGPRQQYGDWVLCRLLFFLLYTPRLPASVSRESPTPRIGESGSRRLPASVSRGVANSPYW
jgi:hypothetical protein